MSTNEYNTVAACHGVTFIWKFIQNIKKYLYIQEYCDNIHFDGAVS